jgi:hypothetical protein
MKPSPSIPRALDAKVTRVVKRLRKSRQLVLREAPGNVLLRARSTGLQAVAHAAASGPTLARVAYTTARSLTEAYVEAIRRGDIAVALSNEYARYDVVLIDDVQELAGKPATQDAIAQLIAACLSSGARILCAATRWPINDAVVGSAWANARVVRLTPPSAEEVG